MCVTSERLQNIFALTFVISSFCCTASHNMYLGLVLYLTGSGLSAFFIIADFLLCRFALFSVSIRIRKVLHKNMHGRWLNAQPPQFILFFGALFLDILQTTYEIKIAKLSRMILCVHAKLCSKNVFRAIYSYVCYSVFLCYSLECLTEKIIKLYVLTLNELYHTFTCNGACCMQS
jgi:hypothetical protein